MGTKKMPEVLAALQSAADHSMRFGHAAKLIKLTPEISRLLLQHNDMNRVVSDSKVQELKRAILGEFFKTNGETIVVSNLGNLLTGQHRCLAVSESDKSVYTWIIYGVAEDAFDTLDQGRKKSASDILGIGGEYNTSLLAAMTRFLNTHERRGKGYNFAPTPYEAELIVERHPLAREWATRGSAKNVKRFMPAPVIAAFCIGEEAYGQEALDLFNQVANGEGLKRNTAAWALRERLMHSSTHQRQNHVVRCAITLLALRSHHRNEERKLLRWNVGDTWPEL